MVLGHAGRGPLRHGLILLRLQGRTFLSARDLRLLGHLLHLKLLDQWVKLPQLVRLRLRLVLRQARLPLRLLYLGRLEQSCHHLVLWRRGIHGRLWLGKGVLLLVLVRQLMLLWLLLNSGRSILLILLRHPIQVLLILLWVSIELGLLGGILRLGGVWLGGPVLNSWRGGG